MKHRIYLFGYLVRVISMFYISLTFLCKLLPLFLDDYQGEERGTSCLKKIRNLANG